MRFKGQFKQIEINDKALMASIDNLLEVAVHQAARVWIEAVTGRVPLWSGMARASLLNLSELVNGTVVLSPLKGRSRIPKGRALGSAEINIKDGEASFTFETQVEHWLIQEVRNVGRSPTAPWRSFDAGARAFQEYANSVLLEGVPFIERNIDVG